MAETSPTAWSSSRGNALAPGTSNIKLELTQLQKSWIKSKEKNTGPVAADDVMRRIRNNKRSFGEEDVMKEHLPQQNVENKKAQAG